MTLAASPTDDAATTAGTGERALVTGGALTPEDLGTVPVELIERIRGAKRVMTVCHRDPEPDALGSALGNALIVEALGGRATAVCADPVPDAYHFLPLMDRFRTAPEPDLDPDLIIVGDCGELARVGRVLDDHAELFSRVPIVNINHHVSNIGFGAVDWVDAESAATCEQVTLLAAALSVPLDSAEGALAAQLMSGVVIDTANFQHPNTTARTLRVASALREAGAPLPEIARRLYRTKQNAQLKLFGLSLSRMVASDEGKLVWTSLMDDDFATAGASPAHSEGLIDLLAQSETAEVAIIFKESGPHTRISVRTREGGVDATVLTGTFGGGGHARASGATLEAPVADAQPLVLAEARRLIAALPDPA
ncbi:MAG: bifunctional oligoribonuclease/PAP phosphatase NrnA [Chloroflexi bacterium]|nr:bifunctional oligoribonuclease/PAP phosphatase NrnA [Chloroflexota bacterium]